MFFAVVIMKKYFSLLVFFYLLSMFSFAQVGIILDTDIDSDVDDVEAVAMVHAF